MECPSCSAVNPEGNKFCGECGTPLALVCASCGTPSDSGKKFCGECGAALAEGSGPAAAPAVGQPKETSERVERRLTSVLFADLVGFTTLSEGRDAEDVRELLSAYFAESSTIVTRYGGIVEKFIGDAVMAVWGVPIAHEDDAERAVRAGFDLIAAVTALGDRLSAPGLTMRVGVLTGEVAVSLGSVGEGMVAGDAVNTAARIQSAATPGQVWVDDRTRSLTATVVSYTDEGKHELRGKAEPLHLYSARALAAADAGARRVDGLEAPFLGRDRDLRLVRELFHASIDEQRPHLVAVAGVAGVGKTRLSWEFEKYVGEITERVRWHRGRILSYGEGVSFWALSEMVRARLGVTDGEATESVNQKLTAGLEELVTEADERAWLRPRLATLLGLDTSQTFPREDLFAAWTAFFERVSRGRACVAMVFDDMQYADAGLLDFLDYLLDAARFPLFVMTLARPELTETLSDVGNRPPRDGDLSGAPLRCRDGRAGRRSRRRIAGGISINAGRAG